MTRQKSDRRNKPQGGRKVVVTAPVETERGGEATTVEQQAWQLGLLFETAENPQGADGGAAFPLRDAATRAAPKSKIKEEKGREGHVGDDGGGGVPIGVRLPESSV
jgi:hypothetical protein